MAAEGEAEQEVAPDGAGPASSAPGVTRGGRGGSRSCAAHAVADAAGVVDLGPGVVEEGVVGAVVDVELGVLAQACSCSSRAAAASGEKYSSLPGDVGEHRGRQLRVVGLGVGPRDEPVERHARGDGVGSLGGEHERQAPAHAEPDHAHLVARRPPPDLVDGAGHVLGGPVELQRHHLLARLVGLGHLRPPVEVGGQRDEAGGREPVTDVLDVGHEAPPLLDHDDAGARPDAGTARYP